MKPLEKAIDSVVNSGNYRQLIGNVVGKYKNHELLEITLVIGGEYVFIFKSEKELLDALKDYEMEEVE